MNITTLKVKIKTAIDLRVFHLASAKPVPAKPVISQELS